ncbi:NrdH-redoxin [Terribacillus saccharophilus]|uniref:NrdH-redoxin n=1 Tax=Terribacillus saccharophilus TaxID=361277 RepID=A0A268HCM0_9BACI|nr:glutaredoxin domain-containing protein [Terribacillus saccharophilus]PAE07580.1 NrdH-redoxin [Terribacillus saccharophilus]
MKTHITIYTSTLCPVCQMTKDFLSGMNIPFQEINIDLKPIAMLKLVSKTYRISVPQTNINGEWVFGFDPVRMLERLKLTSFI